MDIKEKIKTRLKTVGITQQELCEYIDMTPNGFRFSVENKTIELRKLELISEKLKVPMNYWFSEQKNSTHQIFEALERVVNKELNIK